MGCCFSPPRSTSLEDLAAYSKGGALDQPVEPHGKEHKAPAVKCARSSGAVRSSQALQDLTPMAEEPHATPFKAQCGCAPTAQLPGSACDWERSLAQQHWERPSCDQPTLQSACSVPLLSHCSLVEAGSSSAVHQQAQLHCPSVLHGRVRLQGGADGRAQAAPEPGRVATSHAGIGVRRGAPALAGRQRGAKAADGALGRRRAQPAARPPQARTHA